jgi:hypothetical protein
MRDLRNLTIGLLLGICITLAAAPAAAPNNPNGTRYHVVSATPSRNLGSYEFFIHDLQTNKIYYRNIGGPVDGLLVDDILKQH